MPLSNISPGPIKLANICGLVMLATLWQTGQAAAGRVTGHISCGGGSVGISIDIDGEIDAATVESVSKLLEEFREQTKKVASGVTCDDSARHQTPPDFSAYGTHFGINSRGGSVAAAMAIGRMFRRDNAWIGVNGVCFSACVFILAGAVDRQIGKSDQVGIHRPYLRSTPEKPLQGDQIKQAYSRMLQDMRDYLREMNVSQRLADDMLATEPEANRLGLDRREYTRRKMLGETLCNSGASADGIEYWDCKARILKTGAK